jgi:hypothetical protein
MNAYIKHIHTCEIKAFIEMSDHKDCSHHGSHTGSHQWRVAAHATLHCLIGCCIGELAGLMIGVSLGLGVAPTITLAVALAFISGYSLAVWSVMRGGLTFKGALKAVWLGELVSITVMEIAMNLADYYMGGMHAGSVFTTTFWLAFAAAVPAGYIAALPVNYWLIGKELKKCH